MSEQAKKVKNKNIPEWAQGLYYNSGLMSEVLVYHGNPQIRISSTNLTSENSHKAYLA